MNAAMTAQLVTDAMARTCVSNLSLAPPLLKAAGEPFPSRRVFGNKPNFQGDAQARSGRSAGSSVGTEYGLDQQRNVAAVVRLRGRIGEHRHLRDEDHDPAPRRQHGLQFAVHHLRMFANVYPTLILNCILLPLNGLRLFQMRKLIADVERAAASGQSSIDWLMPYMSHRKLMKGEIVFRKGDVADAMFYNVSGRYRLLESGIEIPFGQVFGELGLISPGNVRTQTVECLEDGQALTASYQMVKELYFQNPEFGFYFLRLTSERLFQNISRLEEELAHKNAQLAALALKPA